MSRSSLSEKLVGALPEDDSPVYEAAQLGFDQSHIDTIVELFLDKTIANWSHLPKPRHSKGPLENWRIRAERIAKFIPEDMYQLHTDMRQRTQEELRVRAKRLAKFIPEDIDHNLFIDRLILAVVESGYRPSYEVHSVRDKHSFLNDLFDPTVQVFYDRGRNGFHLDFSPLEFEVQTIARGLAGREDEPLIATYTGDVRSFANYCSYSEINLKGSCCQSWLDQAAYGTYKSTVRFQASETSHLCYGSYLSSFYMDSLPTSMEALEAISKAEECAFYVEGKFSEFDVPLLKIAGFFGMKRKKRFRIGRWLRKGNERAGNRLFRRRGRGWKEVLPE